MTFAKIIVRDYYNLYLLFYSNLWKGRTNMKKLLAITLSLVLCFVAFTACGSGDDKEAKEQDYPIVVKVGHTDSKQRSTHVWAEWLGEYLEEKAPGKFKIEVYSDGSLGDSPDLVAGLGLGTVNMVFDLS